MTTVAISMEHLNIKQRVKFVLDGTVKIILGAFLCVNPLTAPLVMGWLLRYMRNKTIQLWDRTDNSTRTILFWPNWAWIPEAEFQNRNEKNQLKRFIKRYFGAVKGLYKAGVMAMVNMWVMTLPLCLMWLLMWHAGSDMVFHKSSEEVGLVIVASFISALIFSIFMMYLPMAQARQALNEDWRRFFDYGTIKIIVREVRIRLFFMALLYVFAGAALALFAKAIPLGFESVYEMDLKDKQAAKDAVFGHYFRVALFLFIALIILKRMSAKIYAIATLRAVEKGILKPDHLTSLEREFLSMRMKNKKIHTQQDKTTIHKIMLCTGSFMLVLFTLFFWGMFVFTIHVGQFINIHGFDWLSNPLIHMPYIRIPSI